MSYQVVKWLVVLLFALCHAQDEEVRAFLSRFDAEATNLDRETALAVWAHDTNMTEYNLQRSLEAAARYSAFMADSLAEAQEFFPKSDQYDEDTQRKLYLLRLRGGEPKDATARARLHELVANMQKVYAETKVCRPGEETCTLELERHLSQMLSNTSAPEEEHLFAWRGWHNAVGPLLRDYYAEFVTLANQGARDYGWDSTTDLWLAGYDMPAAEIRAEVERLWEEIRPLYEQLHCYVRGKLRERHGARVPEDGPIPAHLLGNMWAQQWNALLPILAPYPEEPAIDVGPELKRQGFDGYRMMNLSESFFKSLGLKPLPESFWERSVIEQPADRSIVCHASAWDLGRDKTTGEVDVRIKMCTKVNQEDLLTQIHELGHTHYQIEYAHQPYLYRNGANDGFHEAIGDAIRLSATPDYFFRMGLLRNASQTEEGVINFQLLTALEKLAFLPFGYLVDRWRWLVFEGTVKPSEYNEAWWRLKREIQGVTTPEEGLRQDPNFFDPGAKYHVPANVPYLRYFISHILQFQLHEGLCEAAGHQGPLHRCSIHGSRAAGERLQRLLAMGASRPWQEALEAVTGSRNMSARALIRYFAPLNLWLQRYNQGKGFMCGWTSPQAVTEPGRNVAAAVAIAAIASLAVAVGIYWYRKSSGNQSTAGYRKEALEMEEKQTRQRKEALENDGL